MRAGLAGSEDKNVPATVTEKPRAFVTLTAPSFGPVHSRRTRRGSLIPCACRGFHHPDDPRLGTAVDPDTYDYVGAVLWQAHTGKLWQRFTITVARKLAVAGGIKVAAFRDHARVSYAKVAEFQRRGLVHFHAVVRIDGPDGPGDTAPAWATSALLEDCVRAAARAVGLETWRPSGTALLLHWGEQVDVRTIHADQAGDFEDADGVISEARLAGYIAKYATKSTGATDGADRQLKSQGAIDQLAGITAHHRRMIQTAWDLGGLPMYCGEKDGLNLRHWAHMLGFRGHFLTKSRRYSTTFTAIRQAQAEHRRREALAELGIDDTDAAEYEFPDRTGATTRVALAGDTVVVNSWNFVSVGYESDEERELAAGIAERLKNNRHTEQEGRQQHG
jgi:hypothetical protein